MRIRKLLCGACLLAAGCDRGYLQSEQLRVSAIELYCSRPWSSPGAQMDAEYHLREYQESLKALEGVAHDQVRLLPYRKAGDFFEDAMEVMRQRKSLTASPVPSDVFLVTERTRVLGRKYQVDPMASEDGEIFGPFLPLKIWLNATSEVGRLLDTDYLDSKCRPDDGRRR